MERCGQLDLARLATVSIICSVVFLISLGWVSTLSAAEAAPIDDSIGRIKELFEQERWDQVVRAASATSARGPDLEYYHGVALARLGRWAEAEDRLLAGHRQTPQDERFSIELGGVAFKQKRLRQATRWLRRAIRISPDHPYANDFLGTIYFIQGNLEAALKFWNRSGKPYISKIEIQPGLRLDPVLLDRALTIAPGSTLLLPDLLTTRRRIAGLGVFSNYSLRLGGRPDGNFELTFAARERNGWGYNKWDALLSILRGAAYRTVHPEYFNLAGAAVNLTSMLRWDAQKRRLQATMSSPLGGDPRYRYWLGVDARSERWELRSLSASLGDFRFRRNAIGGGISLFRSDRWLWSSGAEISHRDCDQISGDASLEPAVRLRGYQLKHTLHMNRELWRFPERRFESAVRFSSETGRVWSHPSQVFERLQISGSARWIPSMTGDDHAMQAHLRAGKIFGQVPFDELFILGLERDNDLWMRAHIGTRDGRKGSAPMGRNYLLSNWEFDKNVYNDGLVVVKLGPFLDIGKITDGRSPLGSRKWLWDTGVQAKLRVLGVGFTFTYGKDLRSGKNGFYVMASQ